MHLIFAGIKPPLFSTLEFVVNQPSVIVSSALVILPAAQLVANWEYCWSIGRDTKMDNSQYIWTLQLGSGTGSSQMDAKKN